MQSFMRKVCWACVFSISLMVPIPRNCFPQAGSENPIRLGIIGLDTSHVIQFTKRFNDPSNPEYVPGARVVAAYKGGSADLDVSRNRVEGFTAELRDKWKIPIVEDIPTLCTMVDAILLESVDGRQHLEQLTPVFAAHKPVFIDKPMATNYKDVKEIMRLAAEAGVPWFSSSDLRFWEETKRLKTPAGVGRILSYEVYGPSTIQPPLPDLMWYGIHLVEMLYTLMGPGCESVSETGNKDEDVIVGRWKDGRLGIMRGFRDGEREYGIVVFGDKSVAHSEPRPDTYGPLLVEIVKFFRTGVSPVPSEETLEMFAFMDAAELSKARGGDAVPISEIEK
jgi:predicted dehydrogenase